MLSDVTTPERVDHVSSQGYAWGYIGSCVPFVICLLLVLNAGKIGLSMEMSMMISFAIIAFWWFGLTLPLLKTYQQKYYVERKPHAMQNSFKRLFETIKNVRKEKKIFLFLLAFFFYIDDVYTIIDMATAYGTALGFESTGLLLALLLTQVVAFPFAILFGRLSSKYEVAKLIRVCILAYLSISIFAIFLTKSYFTKIIPLEKSGEYFGLMDVCGKGASFLGTTVVGVLSQATGQINLSLGALSVFFMLGIVFFRMSEKREG